MEHAAMVSREDQMRSLFQRLWPICRSITGNGLRESLRILGETIPMQLHEVPSRTQVFDWEIPDEWNIEDAWLQCPDGRRICLFKENNLHVVNYSTPVDREMTWAELEPHLHTVPHMPEAIPYITSYYKDHWGFCLTQKEKDSLPREGTYRAFINSEKKPGSLTYGEAVLPGTSDREILFSTYLCHPSMAINELSGPLVTAFLYKALSELPERKHTVRFVFAPETIGIIAYLHRIGAHLKEKLEAGYVITCVGHEGPFTYKRTRRGNTKADRAAEHILRYSGYPVEVMDFAVGGSDERQYCAPGWNLPVGSVMRTMYKRYPEYHTSLDNESIMSYKALQETVDMYVRIFKTLELNRAYQTTVLHCEPRLGKRNLYPNTGAWLASTGSPLDMVHFLAHADGETDLIETAERRQMAAPDFEEIIRICRDNGLIVP